MGSDINFHNFRCEVSQLGSSSKLGLMVSDVFDLLISRLNNEPNSDSVRRMKANLIGTKGMFETEFPRHSYSVVWILMFSQMFGIMRCLPVPVNWIERRASQDTFRLQIKNLITYNVEKVIFVHIISSQTSLKDRVVEESLPAQLVQLFEFLGIAVLDYLYVDGAFIASKK